MTPRWLRRLGIAFGALVVLLVVAAVALIATFDPDREKQLAIDWVKTAHRRTLSIGGPIELVRQTQAALSLKQDALTLGSGTEQTDFSEMRASARIAGGVALSDDLELKNPFLRIGGAGRFDIGRGRVDYTARATVTDSAAGQGAPGWMRCAA